MNIVLKLSLTSSSGKLFEQNGSAVNTSDTLPLLAASGAQSGQMTFTIHKSK